MKQNRFEVAENVAKYIKVLEKQKAQGRSARLYIAAHCDELGIFDWWNDFLSISQLKQMQKFLKVAEELGYNGYVCFKVGAAGCSNGMWAHKEESTNGYSPNGECLYHSFVNGENYYDCKLPDGKWMGNEDKFRFSLKEVKAAIGC